MFTQWRTYVPGKKIYPLLNKQLDTAWRTIAPSHCDIVEYRPCFVRLKNGTTLDCVYVLPAQSYIDSWGCWPEDDPGKQHVSVADVIELGESRYRLPPEIATKIYGAGESGMGYAVFTLVFDDATEQAYVTGNAVDFVTLPRDKTGTNIIEVIPHKRSTTLIEGLDYHWCLFGAGESNRKLKYMGQKIGS